jgi:uncharacterized Zn-binding protein involved in type VI secretion
MPSVTRLGDICSGHGCWHPRPSKSASLNVFVNGRGAVRVTDLYMIHCCYIKCHPGNLIKGSLTVFANGLPIGRIGDWVNCGSVAAQGSMNVFAGG